VHWAWAGAVVGLVEVDRSWVSVVAGTVEVTGTAVASPT